MKKITMILMSLLISVGAMAQVKIQSSTTLPTNGVPEFLYTMKSGNNNYVGAETKYKSEKKGIFAFYSQGGNKYKIYDYSSQQWLTYDSKYSYSSGKGFVKTTVNSNSANSFYINNYNNYYYEISPLKSGGSNQNIYLNYYEGVSANNSISLGLWTDNGSKDPGSSWTFELFATPVKELKNLSNNKVYLLQTKRGNGLAVYNSSNQLTASWNKHTSATSITIESQPNYCKWAIYKSNSGKYYVYSISGNKFWGQTTENNAAIPLTADVTNDVEIMKRSEHSGFPFMLSVNTKATNKGIVNASTNHNFGLINWAGGYNFTDDEGSAFAIIEAGSISQDMLNTIAQKVDEFENPFVIESGQYYRIKSRNMNLSQNQYQPVGTSSVAAFLGSSTNISAETPMLCHTNSYLDVSCIWMLEASGNGWKLKNMNTQKYIGQHSSDYYKVLWVDESNATVFTWENHEISEGTQYGYLKFTNGATTYYLQVLGEGARLAAAKANGTGWTLEEATTLDVTINSTAGYGTIYLPFDVTLPSGLVAYPVTSTNKSYVSLTQGKSDIPANNGAILAGSGNYTLNIENATSDWTGNKLQGSNINTYVQGSAYVLGLVSDNVGLYLAELNKNATGGSGNTHFLNNANKAYLPAKAVPQASQVQALFFNVDETTGVEEVEVESTAKTIYDLSGRKVNGMSAPGLYIVNGKKVLVK